MRKNCPLKYQSDLVEKGLYRTALSDSIDDLPVNFEVRRGRIKYLTTLSTSNKTGFFGGGVGVCREKNIFAASITFNTDIQYPHQKQIRNQHDCIYPLPAQHYIAQEK